MICGNCGTWIEDSKTNCPNCGAPVMVNGQPMMGGQPMMNGQPMMGGQPMMNGRPMMGKQEFYKHASMSKVRAGMIACGTAWYLLAAYNFLYQIVIMRFIPGLLDVALMLGLGLGVHLAKSRVCAGILTAYAVINTAIMIVQGMGNGFLILVVAICSLIITIKFQAAWEKYQKTGAIPMG